MAYIQACSFLHCGVFDRTRTLNQGFDYSVLDPMPARLHNCRTFEQLCDSTGEEIVSAAAELGRAICVLWSGGIDSTAALISIMKAAQKGDCCHKLQVLLSPESIHEYPLFYERYIKSVFREVVVRPPIAECLDERCVNVTGEHGDQLFGSLLLDPFVRGGIALRGYNEVLPDVLVEQFANTIRADRLMSYLAPVIAAAPVPIVTLFDYLWWLNFSLKWQTVTLRLLAFSGKPWASRLYRSLWHFFRGEHFQQWSFGFHSERGVTNWNRYKDIAKEYIRTYTGDEEYYSRKEKEPSLGRVMRSRERPYVPATFIRADFKVTKHV